MWTMKFTLFTSWDSESIKEKMSVNILTVFQFVRKLPPKVLKKPNIFFKFLEEHPELLFLFLLEGESNIDQIQINSVKKLFLISQRNLCRGKKAFMCDLRKKG